MEDCKDRGPLQTMKQLHLRLFGAFEVYLDGAPVTQFEAATARGLLAYLAVERAHPQPRTNLATLLWGFDAGATGMTNLRSSLRRVRSALGDEGDDPAHLQVAQDAIRLDPHTATWVDVQAFESLLAQVKGHAHHRLHHCPWCMARLSEAVALYRGPFLAGLEVDSLPFEEWRQLHQERFHRLAMQALYLLTDFHFRRGAFDQAEQTARRQITLEPWNEEAHQQLIRILDASGQRSAALSQYQQCQRLLRHHLDIDPLPETTALFEAVRQRNSNGWMAELPASSCAAWSPVQTAHNLPSPPTAFLGRQQELDHLLERLVNPAHRLVTLTGEGGVGKTRLALAAAQSLIGSFADGVWFVSLAGLESQADDARLHDAVAGAMADALDLTLSKQQPPRFEAPAHLRKKEMLIVFDNFEHLLPAVGWLRQLQQVAPSLTLLVTSRQRLDLQSEHIVRIQGMPAPDVKDPSVYDHCAVQLFTERATQRWPAFHLDRTNLAAVVQICRRLHGLPLGIELAAALVDQMTPAEIAAALSDGLDLLSCPQSDAPLRQHSMRAVFDYTWTLLTDEERALLAGVTVFRGGFEREAAIMITGATSRVLAALYDKALLHQDGAGRYEMHELLRQFVVARTASEAMADVQERHSLYYLGLLRQQERDLHSHTLDQGLAVIRREFDNLRRAWRWAVEQRAFGLLAGSASHLRYSCHLLGLWQESEHLLAEAVSSLRNESSLSPGASEPPAAETLTALLAALAETYHARGDSAHVIEAAQQLTQWGRRSSLDDARALGHLLWGKTHQEQGRLVKAERRLRIALALAQRAGSSRLEADALYSLGTAANLQGDKPRAHHLLEQALARYRQLGERLEEANTLCALSQVYHYDPSKVYQFTSQRLELARRVGSAVDEFRALHRLAILWLNLGEFTKARTCCQEALRVAQVLNSPRNATFVLDFLALTYHYLDDDLAALHYLDETIRLCEANGDQRGLAYALHWKGQVLLARGELDNAADCYALAVDIRLLHDQPHLAHQSQAGLARVRQTQGRSQQAMALIEPVVSALDHLRRNDVEDPCMLWLNCYWVLQANHDRRARTVLEQAHAILQERAQCISDHALRQSYLQKAYFNREIVAAWQQLPAAPRPQPESGVGRKERTEYTSPHSGALTFSRPPVVVPVASLAHLAAAG
jgi:predicted ATPase/DNA-binding SARP family transcriptional activator